MREFVFPILPVVWLTLLMMYPLQLSWTRIKCLLENNDPKSKYWSAVLEMSLILTLGYGSLLVPSIFVLPPVREPNLPSRHGNEGSGGYRMVSVVKWVGIVTGCSVR